MQTLKELWVSDFFPSTPRHSAGVHETRETLLGGRSPLWSRDAWHRANRVYSILGSSKTSHSPLQALLALRCPSSPASLGPASVVEHQGRVVVRRDGPVRVRRVLVHTGTTQADCSCKLPLSQCTWTEEGEAPRRPSHA